MSGEQPVVISARNVSKNFRLPHEKTMTIKSMFTGLLSGRSLHGRNFESQQALKGISLEVRKGEFFGIVGRNGSGKSTLLKMLAGIYQPTKGEIDIQGRLVPFIELGVGFNPELTGRENVYLNGALLNFSKKEVEAMYQDIVDFAEIEKFMDQKLKNYSSGMQVRLAFSLAIRARADILLVDEVLAVGDADFQRKCFEYFKSLKKNKQTVVFVTHDMNAVREYCDRAILINDGEIAQEGNPDKVAAAYDKLFQDSEEGAAGSEESERWGANPTIFQTVKVAKTGKEITISGHMKFEEEIENPVYGFAIKDGKGVTILGTNTKQINSKTETQAAGSTADFSWTFENILSDGTYSVVLAVQDSSGLKTFDWWDGAASITVKKKFFSPYPVSPETSFEIDKG